MLALAFVASLTAAGIGFANRAEAWRGWYRPYGAYYYGPPRGYYGAYYRPFAPYRAYYAAPYPMVYPAYPYGYSTYYSYPAYYYGPPAGVSVSVGF